MIALFRAAAPCKQSNYERRALEALANRDSVASLRSIGWTKADSIDFTKEADVNELFEHSGMCMSSTHWDQSRPLATRTAAAIQLVFHGYSNVCTKRGSFPNLAMRPRVMREIIREISANRRNGLGGFCDLASITSNPATVDDAVRFLFAAAVMNTFLAGNTSKLYRTDIPARARLASDATYTNHVQLFLEATKRASKAMFEEDTDSMHQTPLEADRTRRDHRQNTPPQAEQQSVRSSALCMNILNGFLDNDQSGAINGQQFIDILAIALEEIDLYSHLQKFAENVVKTLQKFRQSRGRQGYVPTACFEVQQVSDSWRRMEREASRLNRTICDLKLLNTIGRHVTDLKEPVKEALARIREDIQMSKDERAMKRDAALDADDIDEKASKDMRKIITDVFKKMSGNPNTFQQNHNKNKRPQEFGTPHGDKKAKGGESPPKGKDRPPNVAILELTKLIQKRLPSVTQVGMRNIRKKTLQQRCVSCKGATQKRQDGDAFECAANCKRTTLHADFRKAANEYEAPTQ